jgi:AcrR family transcriptional regulator
MKLKNSKEAILNHALAIFGRLGFHKTTMADIANASKKGRRTLYLYFKNKEEVYEAVVERELEKVIELLKSQFQTEQPAIIQLSEYVGLRLKSVVQLTRYHDALRIAYQTNYKWVEKIRAKLDAEDKIIITSIIKNGCDKGELKISHPELTVNSILFFIQGIEFMLIKEDSDQMKRIQIENLKNLITNGVNATFQNQIINP